MLLRLRNWLMPSLTGRGSLRWGFSGVYLGMVGMVLIYFNLINPHEEPAAYDAVWGITVVLLLLLGVERYEVGLASQSKRMAVMMVLVRIALVEAIVTLDSTRHSLILYPIIPFVAFFSVGKRASYTLAFATWLLAFGHIWLADPAWYLNLSTITNLFLITLALAFMQAISYLLDINETSQEQTRQLLAQLATSHRRLQLYAQQVGELAAAEERNRLAREIHDTLGHHLTAINVQLEKALAYQELDPTETNKAVWNAKHSAHEALGDVRQSVSTLRQRKSSFSLNRALTELVESMNGSELTINLDLSGDETGYTHPVLMVLFRVVQEGLTNIRKHAQAEFVNLSVHYGDKWASLHLKDDGVGFDTSMLEIMARSTNEGFGLQGICERLELVGGTIDIHSKPDQGTELMVTVPKNPDKLFNGSNEQDNRSRS
ncbi:MAG: sensor histidine kinase [Anaerolineales bacterium]|nr:sensor histidine kinase [Anaerolineales bacterium]